jgi:hypothetical protein
MMLTRACASTHREFEILAYVMYNLSQCFTTSSERCMDILARVQSYSELRSAFAVRQRELGLTHLEVDDIAGLQTGYFSKLQCGLKNFGPMSLDAVLGALGVEIVLVRSDEVHRALSSALAVKAS